MTVRNLMEDIVSNILNELVKNDKDLSVDSKNREDILAFVLNRISPKYVTSERGVLHGKLDTKFITQQKTDIFLLIYEAVDIIKSRRASEAGDIVSTGNGTGRYFPHIIGEVLEETTFSIVPDISIDLLYDGKLVEMADENWKNPFETNDATMGYFHFWPKWDEDTYGNNEKVAFELVFSHPKFEDKRLALELDVMSKLDFGKSFTVPLALLKIREGENPDFLYVE